MLTAQRLGSWWGVSPSPWYAWRSSRSASISHTTGAVNRAIAINRLAGVPFLALIGLLVQADPLWVLVGATGVLAAVLAADMAV